MTPDKLWRATQHVGVTALGFFILIHETLSQDEPNLYLIGAATTCLGLPLSRRADERRKEGLDDPSP